MRRFLGITFLAVLSLAAEAKIVQEGPGACPRLVDHLGSAHQSLREEARHYTFKPRPEELVDQVDEIVEKVRERVPNAHPLALAGVLSLALENGIQHGSTADGAHLEMEVSTDGKAVVVSLLNDAPVPLPPTLLNREVRAGDPPFEVPYPERDLSANGAGVATGLMVGVLFFIMPPTRDGRVPAIHWREPAPGQVLYQLSLPIE
jgi:hypothetical protein